MLLYYYLDLASCLMSIGWEFNDVGMDERLYWRFNTVLNKLYNNLGAVLVNLPAIRPPEG